MVMWSLLDPRLWLAAIVLVGAASGVSYFKGRSDGKTICEAKHAEAVTAANVEARKIENRRQAMVDDAARAAAARTRSLAADAARARSESRGLRDDLRAVELHASQSRTAADNAVRALSAVVAECGATLVEVASDADSSRSEVKTLRDAWPR
jgi:hypothetical protein